jgi:hypothetical protein
LAASQEGLSSMIDDDDDDEPVSINSLKQVAHSTMNEN